MLRRFGGDVLKFYDRDGKPLEEVFAWADLYSDLDYRIVRHTIVRQADRLGVVLDVGTVWVGHDLSFGASPSPLIFETMIMRDGRVGYEIERWTTETAARNGHALHVARAARSLSAPIIIDIPVGETVGDRGEDGFR